MLIYVASPCRGDRDRNYANTVKYCRMVAEMGHTPIVPHLMYANVFNDNEGSSDWETIKRCNRELMAMCNGVWFFLNPAFSKGMELEWEWAIELWKERKIISKEDYDEWIISKETK